MSSPNWDVMLATCPSRTSLARIANKWTALIVIALDGRRLRFTELRERVEGISGKVLSETLRDLERDGILHREAFAQIPPRVEYELTDLGQTLSGPLNALGRWAEEHIEAVEGARAAYDARVVAG